MNNIDFTDCRGEYTNGQFTRTYYAGRTVPVHLLESSMALT
jgi:hypothetical protein